MPDVCNSYIDLLHPHPHPHKLKDKPNSNLDSSPNLRVGGTFPRNLDWPKKICPCIKCVAVGTKETHKIKVPFRAVARLKI